MCIDHTLATSSGDRAPPMLICIDCADQIYRGRSRDTLVDILLPMEGVSFLCENKSCKSSHSQRVATCTCFSIECANYNCSKPVRYCTKCDQSMHEQDSEHICHRSLGNAWQMEPEMQSYFIEAVIGLLKEAAPVEDKNNPNTSSGGSSTAVSSGTPAVNQATVTPSNVPATQETAQGGTQPGNCYCFSVWIQLSNMTVLRFSIVIS